MGLNTRTDTTSINPTLPGEGTRVVHREPEPEISSTPRGETGERRHSQTKVPPVQDSVPTQGIVRQVD